ncbi:hypothetical protein LX16_1197 [Stackebrandtia albiflava]|uniref:Uncharacterized protein n=1 Tax=Stackebrandtia albiflava TaxID=406432 RepID=A0A562VCD6_9ACTN|nr:hypothetical protein [Stackebrandtia albiflava]TWJ15487.1 hypothetical protein LX16_1197 [Stackebrandtia albiflava]
MPHVLGIAVSDDLLAAWSRWFAPPVQPFRVGGLSEELASALPPGHRSVASAEVRDTFHMYGGEWIWLDEPSYYRVDPRARRVLLDDRASFGRRRDLPDGIPASGARFPWWPSLLGRVGNGPVRAYVESGVAASRHREVPPAVWVPAAPVLPEAARLAGTFAAGSGPNCFGTVMAAAGVPGAESVWMFQDPFERWIAARTVPVAGPGRDAEPGVVLVWRDATGLAAHAAVTLGGGFALNKPSQSWSSPRLVWTVRETITAGRHPGFRLSRHLITGARTSRP